MCRGCAYPWIHTCACAQHTFSALCVRRRKTQSGSSEHTEPPGLGLQYLSLSGEPGREEGSQASAVSVSGLLKLESNSATVAVNLASGRTTSGC